MIKVNKKNNRGFTLLFAVLISTLVLAIGVAIISIALKQLVISGSARDSQFAFYAANTGAECARYWNANTGDGFPLFVASGYSATTTDINSYPPKCLDTVITDDSNFGPTDDVLKIGEDEIPANTYNFRIEFQDPGGSVGDLPYCVDVRVYKGDFGDDDSVDTVIDARGYNTCDSSDPRRIERGLRIENIF